MQLVTIPKQSFECRHLVGGEWRRGDSTFIDVESPYTGQSIGKVPVGSKNIVEETVSKALLAFASWRSVPIKERSRPLYAYRQLVIQHIDELANLAAIESGKTFVEARAGIEKGLEVVEFALSLQNIDTGGALEVSRGVTCQIRREPLGVVAGIVPFNFPAMVPMWMYPIAITLGNCFILKPSEKVPLTMSRMGELMVAAGFPPGVFSLLHGDKQTVQDLISHEDVRAVGFVGSTQVARQVYQHVTQSGRRCLALGGAKNYNIVVPDADPELTVNGIVDSFTGCAGQRCMAASIMIAVGDVQPIIDKIVARAKSIQLASQMGAIIDHSALKRIQKAIEQAESDQAQLLLDGRNAIAPQGFEGGYWLAPTIIDRAEPNMLCATQEIFGPVLTIIRVASLEKALQLEKKNPYGNATSIFTTSGAAARYVSEHATNGMIGINIGVPVPREPFSFGGTKSSKFGHSDITGTSVLDFWTDLKKITTKWSQQGDQNWMS